MKKTNKHKVKQPIATKGEGLFRFLRQQLNLDGNLYSTTPWMSQLDNAELWSMYVEEFMTLNLAARLLSSGRFLKRKYANSTVFETEYKSLLNEHLSLQKGDRDRLYRLATAAVDASTERISDGTRNSLTVWAKTNHSHCYLCGRALDFSQSDTDAKFSIDHIWPRAFGGDSSVENLLPACKGCNSKHKQDYPTWSMTNIQALLLGIEPNQENLDRIPGTSRFAIHHRVVQNVAVEKNLTLKDAYLDVGPSEAVRVVDRLEFAHFFNLVNVSAKI